MRLARRPRRHLASTIEAVTTMIKYWQQLAVSAPAILLLVLAILRHLVGLDVSFIGVEWLIGANVLSFAACLALALLQRENKAWRYAALFNAWLFILALTASILRLGA